MYKDVKKEDCLYLNSDQHLKRFLELTNELELFTLILPVEKLSFLRVQFLYDIWYMLTNLKVKRIENPENMMIYPVRTSFVKMVENYPIKRFIQKSALENDRLAYICAIYILKAVGEYFRIKVQANECLASDFRLFENYQTRSMRAIYNEQYQVGELYPKNLALLQRKIVTEINEIYNNNKLHFHWYMNEKMDEAEKVYESVFGLVNDWGGRVP